MANQYDTNLKLQAIADAIGNSASSGLISALEDIADAVAGGGGGGSSTAGLVSDNFSETDTYDLGDYCIHNNTLYVCINAITTPGSWDLSDWQATNAGIQLSSLNSALEDTGDAITALATRVTNKVQEITISNLATVELDETCVLLFIRRYFNANKSALFLRDFSGTVGSMVNNFTTSELSVTFANGKWTIQNKINGVISLTAIYAN